VKLCCRMRDPILYASGPKLFQHSVEVVDTEVDHERRFQSSTVSRVKWNRAWRSSSAHLRFLSMLNREPMKGKHANIIAKPFHTMPRHFGALAVLCQLSTPCVLKAEWPNLSLEGNSIRF